MPLLLQLFLPLALGLLMKSRYEEEAAMARPIMGEIASLSLVALLVVNLVNIGKIARLAGSGAFASVLGVIVLALITGYLLGGPGPEPRRTVALSTGQRNYAAAFVIADESFPGRPAIMLMLLAASVVSLVVIMLAAGEIGRQAKAQH